MVQSKELMEESAHHIVFGNPGLIMVRTLGSPCLLGITLPGKV